MMSERRFQMLTALRNDTESILDEAKQYIKDFQGDAINWGDLHCLDASECFGADGKRVLRVYIEECSPDAGTLRRHIIAKLRDRGYTEDIDIVLEW